MKGLSIMLLGLLVGFACGSAAATWRWKDSGWKEVREKVFGDLDRGERIEVTVEELETYGFASYMAGYTKAVAKGWSD